MSVTSLVRIQKEYKEVREGKEKDGSGITAELVDNQFTHWKGSLKGPVRLQPAAARTARH